MSDETKMPRNVTRLAARLKGSDYITSVQYADLECAEMLNHKEIIAAIEERHAEEIAKLQEQRDYYAVEYPLEWRGIDKEDVCQDCGGRGIKSYGATAGWRGGAGGQMITSGVCNKCWGSGSKSKPWANLKDMEGAIKQARREAYEDAARIADNFQRGAMGIGAIRFREFAAMLREKAGKL